MFTPKASSKQKWMKKMQEREIGDAVTLRLLTLRASMSFFSTVKANYIIMLAIRNCVSLSPTTETPLRIATTSVTLMIFFSTPETNNFIMTISSLGTTLVIHPYQPERCKAYHDFVVAYPSAHS